MADFVSNILDWYDANARVLPWRQPPGAKDHADPYAVWLSEIMLQQTQVVTVIPYFGDFLQRWPNVQALAAADEAEVMAAWAGLGYYRRARNLLKCARVVSADYQGVFPSSEAELLELPGVGPYTAAAIAAIAFNKQATVVDGNIERVMARIHKVETPLPTAKPALKDHAAQLTPATRSGDYAQALMDLGATVCTPRAPLCAQCPVQTHCRAHSAGIAAELPRRIAKPAKPTRFGITYFVMRPDGAVLLETRPKQGLLAGMLALPCSDWVEGTPVDTPPITARWQVCPTPVRHVFTHFKLILSVHVAWVEQDVIPTRGAFITTPKPDHLPSVMRKAFHTGKAHLCDIGGA